jgi:ubiquinone/menaquinone biosynthesis C-methylase UbiE
MSREANEFYEKNYATFCNSGAVGLVSKVIHTSIEILGTRIINNEGFQILEVGAGNGQHFAYVRGNFSRYVMTDIRPDMFPADIPKVEFVRRSIDAQNLPYEDESFDRLIATCLLAHIDDPAQAIEEWLRVVKTGGILSIYIPCEPGFLLRFFQATITHPKKLRLGVSRPKLFHYREHKNSYVRILEEISCAANVWKIRRYPFPFFSWNLNLWSIVQITKSE